MHTVRCLQCAPLSLLTIHYTSSARKFRFGNIRHGKNVLHARIICGSEVRYFYHTVLFLLLRGDRGGGELGAAASKRLRTNSGNRPLSAINSDGFESHDILLSIGGGGGGDRAAVSVGGAGVLPAGGGGASVATVGGGSVGGGGGPVVGLVGGGGDETQVRPWSPFFRHDRTTNSCCYKV